VESGGNFHGEPVAFAMDFLGIAMSEIGWTTVVMSMIIVLEIIQFSY